MTKPVTKVSDRGRHSPEPGPTPGTRAEQRDTDEQLAAGRDGGDEATAWERDEQEHLPPRGEGSQHNQGEDRGAALHDGEPRVASSTDEEAGIGASARGASAPGTTAAEFHSGGTRGPSNDNRG